MDEAQIATKFPIGSRVECETFDRVWVPATVTGGPAKDKFWSIYVHIDNTSDEHRAWPVRSVRHIGAGDADG